MVNDIIAVIERARASSGLSQRDLGELCEISQPTLNRILSGERPIKMTEVIRISDATDSTVVQLCGSAVTDRVECVAALTEGSSRALLYQPLLRFMEIDSYLDEQGIPST
ncbi:MAG: helix-turn-helix domain-containing protein [Gulosibacter sp.]|uniref:helix-turn-helix domain-containing protein n=1 Tax=Gulosibacter sp. TaxID=2817531 RepID=UPI003F8EC827